MDELAHKRGLTNLYAFSDEMLETLGEDYKSLGELYDVLNLMNTARLRHNIFYSSSTPKFWHNKAIDTANWDNIASSASLSTRARNVVGTPLKL